MEIREQKRGSHLNNKPSFSCKVLHFGAVGFFFHSNLAETNKQEKKKKSSQTGRVQVCTDGGEMKTLCAEKHGVRQEAGLSLHFSAVRKRGGGCFCVRAKHLLY